MLTKKPANRKISSLVFSILLKKSIVPEETLQPKRYYEFMNHAGQFERILSDSGFISLKLLKDEELVNQIIQYLNLQNNEIIIRDIEFKDEWKIGEKYYQLFTMADSEFVPSLCGSRINYDKYK